MVVVIAGLVVGQTVGIHVVHHFLGHQGAVLGIFFRCSVGIGLALRAGGNARIGVSLGLPGLVEQLGNELLLLLGLGDGLHLVHGLGFGGFRQFQLQLGKHELQARGGTKLSQRNRGGGGKIDLTHREILYSSYPVMMKRYTSAG